MRRPPRSRRLAPVARPARRAGLALLALAAALALACGRRAGGPITGPGPILPPPPERVEAEYPPPRSAGVLYDTPIWVQFTVPVDTATINERTVFFKADTQRLAATRTWDPATRRVVLVPASRLALRTTYTVELSAAIRFTDGSTLGTSHAWQFTTNSLRRVQTPSPFDGKRDQSPFVALQWGGLTETSAGPITYEIHAGPDSASAVDPAGPASPGLFAPAGPPFVPRVRWRQDQALYWAVHAINGATGERLVGPAWRFSTIPAGAAFDSIPVLVTDWDWVEASNTGRQRCTEDSLVMGPRDGVISTIRWNPGVPDTNLRLTGVAIDMTPRYFATVPATVGPSVWYAVAAFPGCAHGVPVMGPPNTDETRGRLADAVVLRPDRIRFSSDALTAHVEASRRLGGLYGYMFRTPGRRSFFGPGAGSEAVRAIMWLYVYRPPAGPASLAGGRFDR